MSNYSTNKIDTAPLKSWNSAFKTEKKSFSNSAYSSFSNSYINSCSDSAVLKMSNRLSKLYGEIDLLYKNIENWWDSYISNAEALENYIAKEGSLGSITDGEIRGLITGKLSDLQGFTFKYEEEVKLANDVNVNLNTMMMMNSFHNLDYNQYVLHSYKNNVQQQNNKENLKNDIIEALGFNEYAKEDIAVAHILLSLQATNEAINDVNVKIKALEYEGRYGKKRENYLETQNSLKEQKESLQESKDLIIESMASYFDTTSDELKSIINFYNSLSETEKQNFYGYPITVVLEKMNTSNSVESNETNETSEKNWFERLTATRDVACFSVLEGLGQLDEAMFDTMAILTTAKKSVETGYYDLAQAAYGKLTGKEWESKTKDMWDLTMNVVSKDFVTDAFDWFYNDTKIGQEYKNDAYGFDTVRSVGNGIGYFGGMTALTVATGGIAGLSTSASTAVIATTAGFGKHTASAWADGATLEKGLTYGAARGAWDGFEVWLGGQIGASNISNVLVNKGVMSSSASVLTKQLVNTGSHVVMDTADAATSAFMEPLLKLIYTPNEKNMDEIMSIVNKDGGSRTWDELSFDEKYKVLFEYNGGMNTVFTEALMGAFMSGLSEVGDISSAIKTDDILKNINQNIEIDSTIVKSIDELNDQNLAQLLNSLSSKEKFNDVVGKLDINKIANISDQLDNKTLLKMSENKEFFDLLNYKQKMDVSKLRQSVDLDKKLKLKYALDNIKNNTINFTKGITGTIIAGADALLMTTNPIFILPGIKILHSSLEMAQSGFYGNMVKDSSFMIIKNKSMTMDGNKIKVDYLSQDALNLSGLKEDNKSAYFILQALNAFQQLPKQRNGVDITYGTCSQGFTRGLLKKLQNKGYIKNYNENNAPAKSLFLERLVTGVDNKKAAKMYNMTFELTDKKFDATAVKELLGKNKINIDDYVTKIDKNGNIIFYNSVNAKKYSQVAINLVKDKIFTKLKTTKVDDSVVVNVKKQTDQIVEDINTKFDEIKTSSDLPKDFVNLKDITNQNLDEKIKEAMKNDTTFENFIENVKKCNIEDVVENFDSVENFKKALVKNMIENNMLNEMDGYYLYLITTDNTMLTEMIGEKALENFTAKNIVNNAKTLVPTYNSLTIEQFNTLFDSETVKKAVNDLDEIEFSELIENFVSNNNSMWLNNETIATKMLELNFEEFYSLDYSISNFIRNLDSTKDNTNFYNFLEKCRLSFWREEVFWNDPSLLRHTRSMILTSNPDVKLKELQDWLNDLNVKISNQIETGVIENSYIQIPKNLEIKDFDKGKYYTIVYEIDGLEYSKDLADKSTYSIKLRDFLEKEDLIQTVLEGRFKLKKIKLNDIKNRLVFDRNNGVSEGINKIKLFIDGKEQTILKESSTDVVCDLNSKFESSENIKLLSIEPVASNNIKVDLDNKDKIYMIKANIGGKQSEFYFTPIKEMFGGNYFLDLDSYIIENNLIDISILEINELDLSTIKRESVDILKKDSKFIDLFNDKKYGGAQEDVSDLVKNFLSSRPLSKIDTLKASLLLELTKKYFPTATEVQIQNIADHYTKSGCNYMAMSNAFITYMGKFDNSIELFKNKFGYDLMFSDGNSSSYNVEALAYEMYLNDVSKNYVDDIDTMVKTPKGVSKSEMEEVFGTFFEDRDIIVKIHTTDPFISFRKNSEIERIESVLNNKEGFSILLAKFFDLEQLDLNEISNSADAALANSKVNGKIVENIGGHAMLVTGLDKDNNLIVSSWGRKYKFISNSLNGRNSSFGMIVGVNFEIEE